MKSLVLKDLFNIGHNAKSMLFILVVFCRCAYSVFWRRRLYLCVCDFVQHDDCNNLLF